MAEHPEKYLHKVVEIQCMMKDNKEKTLRYGFFLRIRDDKNENECKIILPDNLNLSQAHIDKIEKKLNDILKSLARKYIYEAMDKYIKITGLAPQKIEIRKFKSIWGNCNSNKIIKMNQNLVHYGKDQIEYVCLHELTHLKHMNHSKRFWAHVEKYMPNYKQISKVLKG